MSRFRQQRSRQTPDRAAGVGDTPVVSAPTSPANWYDWHASYDRDSPLRERLEVVRTRVREALDRQEAGPIRIVSVCAGQGRDLVPVVAAHPRRRDVVARLVELDPRNVEIARTAVASAGLSGVEVVIADAGVTAAYDGAVPAGVVLVCGVFGNVSDEDIMRTIDSLPSLCAAGATVIWTRGRTAPDLTPSIRRWFERRGFEELSFDGEPGSFGVGAHRLRTRPEPFDSGLTLFTFLDFDELRARPRPTSGADAYAVSYRESVTAPSEADETSVA